VQDLARSRAALLHVPAEVDLGTDDLVLVVEREDLGIPPSAAAGGVAFVGDDHFIARLDQPDETEFLVTPCAGPAPLEVAVAVQLRVGRSGELEVIAEALLEEAPVSGLECGIAVADDLLAVGGNPLSLIAISGAQRAKSTESATFQA